MGVLETWPWALLVWTVHERVVQVFVRETQG